MTVDISASTKSKIVHPKLICVNQSSYVLSSLQSRYEDVYSLDEYEYSRASEILPLFYTDCDVLIYDFIVGNGLDYNNRQSIINGFESNKKRKKIEFIFVCQRPETYCSWDLSDKITFSNTLRKIEEVSDKRGREIYFYPKFNSLQKYSDSLNYFATFIIDESDNGIVPILKNRDGDCVGVVTFDNNIVQVVLPAVTDDETKVSFLFDLIKNIGFKYAPDVFVEETGDSWFDAGYYPPEVNMLIKARDEYKEAAILELKNRNKEIQSKKLEYKFLKDLLTSSGSDLVAAVKTVLERFGFENVIDCDIENKGGQNKAEDLRIEDLAGTRLVIEVKGINGTSTDSDCSQIDKRARSWVFKDKNRNTVGLYIVNYQRYMAINQRSQKPFTTQQIEDACGMGRGMMTTSFLYHIFICFAKGWIDDDLVRPIFLKTGYINSLSDDEHRIGTVDRYYSDKKVCGISGCTVDLTVDEYVLLQHGNEWCKARILSLRLEKEGDNVTTVEPGVGFSAVFETKGFISREGTQIYSLEVK